MENQQQSYTTATVEGPSTAPLGIAADTVDEERLAVLQQVSVLLKGKLWLVGQFFMHFQHFF